MTDKPDIRLTVRYQAMQTHENFRATEAVLQAIGALTALNNDNRFDRLLRSLEEAGSSLQRAYLIRGPIEPHLIWESEIS